MRPALDTRGPLGSLAGILRRSANPPALSSLGVWLGQADDYNEFVRLVEEYLPDHRADILDVGSAGDMISAFARFFSERYFPLDDRLDVAGGLEGFRDLMSFIPVAVFGWECDDYDNMCDHRNGVVLASLLVNFEAVLDLDSGIRITLVEKAAKLVPPRLLLKLPERGYPLEFLRDTLKDSPYPGLLWHALAMCHETECVFYDAIQEEMWQNPMDWSRDNIDWLTEQWRTGGVMSRKLNEFLDWLEEDPERHFAEVINFLERRANGTSPVDDRQLRLALEFA